MAKIRPPSTTVLILILVISTAPHPSLSYFNQYRTLLSLSHSLLTRVANMRAERGDISGSKRVKLISEKLERGLGIGFVAMAWSVGWDYVSNYAWRELDHRELYGAVSDLTELMTCLRELGRVDSETGRATWVRQNYENVLGISKRLLVRLLHVFRQSGALREVVETVKTEVVDGELLRDCLEVPCYFIFGDSLVDNGNNNQLSSLARANYMPYGIDFPNGPTGRFSNGKTTVDVIAELLGFDAYISPYSTARGQDILRGVNYASAAAGIREETGRQLGGRIDFRGQVQNYRNTVQQVVNLLGDEDSASNYLSKCIYSIGLGSNDYLNNYFMPLYYSSSRQYNPEQWADILIQEYTQQLSTLYDYGARKFVLIGVGQIGCSPSELAQNSPDGRTCVAAINSANQIFNNKLKALVDQFNNNRSDAKFIYTNVYGIFQDIINNPSQYGFRVTNRGCCGVGRNNGQITCLPLQTPCPNRKEYAFWDAFHPTEAANAILGRRSYSAQSPSDSYPIDIRSLAQL